MTMEKQQKSKKERLDVLLVEQGFFESRENAKRHIMAGVILVNDVPVDKPGTKIPADARLRIKGTVMPYVGRGGFKLEKAIQAFHLPVEGAVMADIGASTGGFTDCALQHGAAKVYAIDVGYNQLDWKLRNDPRVVNLEKTNIKDVTLATLGETVDLIATDISFISVLKIFPAAKEILKPEGHIAILIKPQFEAGRDKVGKGGIVRDAKTHRAVIQSVTEAAYAQGFSTCALTFSPIKGGAGNIEFLAHLRLAEAAGGVKFPSEEEIQNVVADAHAQLDGEKG